MYNRKSKIPNTHLTLTHKQQQEDGDEHIKVNVGIRRHIGDKSRSENLLPSEKKTRYNIFF